MCHTLLLLLLLAASGVCGSQNDVQTIANQDIAAATRSIDETQPLVCIIIRTYWAHGGQYGNNNLAKMLKGFQEQSHSKYLFMRCFSCACVFPNASYRTCSWVAQLIVLDNRAFPDLRYIVRDLKDDRVWVYAEWVSAVVHVASS